jgi:hypothetical protein
MRDLVVRGLFEPRIHTVEIPPKDEFWDLPFSMLESSHLVLLHPAPHLMHTRFDEGNGRGSIRWGPFTLRDGHGAGEIFHRGYAIYGLSGNGIGVHELWKYWSWRR